MQLFYSLIDVSRKDPTDILSCSSFSARHSTVEGLEEVYTLDVAQKTFLCPSVVYLRYVSWLSGGL